MSLEMKTDPLPLVSLSEDDIKTCLDELAQENSPIVVAFLDADKVLVAGASAKIVHPILISGRHEAKWHRSPILSADCLHLKLSVFGKVVKRLLQDQRHVIRVYEKKNEKTWTFSEGTPSQYQSLMPFLDDEDEWPATFLDTLLAVYEEDKSTLGLCIWDRLQHRLLLGSVTDSRDWNVLRHVIEQYRPIEVLGYRGHSWSSVLPPTSFQPPYVPILKEKVPRDVHEAFTELSKMAHIDSLGVVDRVKFKREEKGAILASSLLFQSLSGSSPPDEKFSLSPLELHSRMVIPRTTQIGLHLLGEKSLFAVLNRCCTKTGPRLLQSWMLQPLVKMEEIHARLDSVETLIHHEETRKTLHLETLRKLPDFSQTHFKMEHGRLKMVDLIKAYMGVNEVESILRLISGLPKSRRGRIETIIQDMEPCLKALKKFCLLVEKIVDFESYSSLATLRMRRSFDETLESLYQDIEQQEQKMTSLAARERKSHHLDEKVKLEENDVHGFFFRVTLKEEKAIRNKKMLHIFDSNKSGLRFRTHEMDLLNSEYMKAKAKHAEHEAYLLSEIATMCKCFSQQFLQLDLLVTQIDCLVSLATVAISAPIPYVRPELNDTGTLDMKQVRHPILESINDLNFIPNDVTIDDSKSFLIITGPNLGEYF